MESVRYLLNLLWDNKSCTSKECVHQLIRSPFSNEQFIQAKCEKFFDRLFSCLFAWRDHTRESLSHLKGKCWKKLNIKNEIKSSTANAAPTYLYMYIYIFKSLARRWTRFISVNIRCATRVSLWEYSQFADTRAFAFSKRFAAHNSTIIYPKSLLTLTLD